MMLSIHARPRFNSRLTGAVLVALLCASTARADSRTAAPAEVPRSLQLPAQVQPARAELAYGAVYDALFVPSEEPAKAQGQAASVESVLTFDGRIRSGVQGSFSAAGYAMQYAADGSPRFVKAGTAMATNGSFAATFANNVLTVANNSQSGFVYALAVSGTDLYVGGIFADAGGNTFADNIARWDGTRWNALGRGVASAVRALAVSGTSVYVGGEFTTAISSSNAAVPGTMRIARWDGTQWNGVGGGLYGSVYALAVSGTDLYVGGDFTDAGFVTRADYVARWDGAQWNALGGGVYGSVYALAVSGTNVYVGGIFSYALSAANAYLPNTRYIARWDGTQWNTLGGGTQSYVYAIAVSGSDVYVGGGFTSAYSSGTTAVPGTNYVARWSGAAWSALGGGVQSYVVALAVSGSDVYVGGGFTSAYSSGTTAVPGTNYVARWDGAAWSALGGGVQSAANAFAVNGSDVYVGGSFTTAYAVGNTSVPGTIRIARWNGTQWNVAIPSGGVNGGVNAVAVSGADVYIGGNFTDAGGNLSADFVARWDGTKWNALGGGTQSYVYAIAVSGSDVYVGGSFTSAYSSGTAAVTGTGYIARWDGNQWNALGGGTQNAVQALAVSGTNVYVGGTFTGAYSSGTTAVPGTNYVARWDGAQWNALGGGTQSWVMALAVSGSDVYVGGAFNSAYSSGTTQVAGTRAVARWNGNAWSGLGGGAANTVRAIAVSGSDVYVGGDFSYVYSLDFTTVVPGTAFVARWNGSAWSTLGGGVSNIVYAIAASGRNVLVGGLFTSAYSSGTTSVSGTNRIALWDGTQWNALNDGTATGADNTVSALALNGTDLYLGGNFTTAGSQLSSRVAKFTSGALPVELASFTATTDGASALLRWTTASETNNAGFAVEARASNTSTATWRELDFVPGHGTTTEQHAYAHRVEGLAAGTYRFRLRQVDLDGTVDYSAEVEAVVGLDAAFVLTAPHPNPAQGASRLRLTVREAQPVAVRLYDALGREVATLYNGPVEAARAVEMLVETVSLPAGVYVVRASGAHFTATRTLTVTR